MKHQIPLPFGVSSYLASEQSGETPGKSAAGFLGFTKAPYYMSHTKGEQAISDTVRDQMPAGSQTKERFDQAVAERKAVAAIKRGDTTLNKAVEDGLIAKNRKTAAANRVKDSALQYGVLRANNIKKVLAAWDLFNPDERAETKKIILNKIENSQILTAQEKREAKKKIKGD